MSKSSLFDKLRNRAFPLAVLGIVATLALMYRGELTAWLRGDPVRRSNESTAVHTQAADVSIGVALDPDPPRQGKNALIVTLTRGAVPLVDAELSAVVSMPAMGAMPEMRSTATVDETAPGVYRASFELSMGGSWTATIDAQIGGTSVSARYGLTVGMTGLTVMGDAMSTASSHGHEFSPDARNSLLAGLDAYEAIRSALGNDTLQGIGPASDILASAFQRASEFDADTPAALATHLVDAIAAARLVGASTTIEEARNRFSELSKSTVALVAADDVLNRGRVLFDCPMWDDYNRWLQPSDDIGNPYMGQAMPTCGSVQDWDGATMAAPAHTHDRDDVSHYTCSMHPWVKMDDPDEICPVCGMDLTPVTVEEISQGIVRIDRLRRQSFGVRTDKVVRRHMTVPVRAVGRVAYDERRLTDVTLKYKAWIERLFVEETGALVKKGQPLFAVYSPKLFAAQHELILAAKQVARATTEIERSRAAALLSGVRKRMRLWDLSDAQVDAIIKNGEPFEQITVRSPASGYVIEKDIVEGGAVEPGQRLYRLVDLTRVWVEAEIFEEHIPLVTVGQPATVRLSHVPSAPMSGKVSFIHPNISERTRTARIRIELANRDHALKPDMFAEVDIDVDYGEKLVVPEAAIVYSGPRRIVFVDIGQDRLRPTLVKTGIKSGGYVEILSGLGEGDTVVVSGNFLVAAESRLKSATGIW